MRKKLYLITTLHPILLTPVNQNTIIQLRKMLLNSYSCSYYPLCEICPNTEFFSGPHFTVFLLKTSKSPYSVKIWENTDQKKLRIWTNFTQ